MIIGYARVSSSTQNLARQIEELEKYGCEKIFKEKVSGKNFERIEYKKMRKQLRFGDVLVIHDLSRFGRNKEEIMNEWKSLIEDEIDIVVLSLPILNTAQYKNIEGVGKLVSEIFLAVMSWLVEEERVRIKAAQRQGIEIAKRNGKYKGREKKYHANASNPKDRIIYEKIVSMLESGSSVMDIHKATNVARMTIYGIKDDISK